MALAIAVCAVVADESALTAQFGRKREPLPKAATLLLPVDAAWMILLPDGPSAAGVLLGSAVVVPLASGELHALDRDSGKTLWVQRVQTKVPPVVAGPHLVIATDTDVEARAVDTGDIVWSRPLDAPLLGLGGTIDRVVVLGQRTLIALDARAGDVKWRHDIGHDAMSLAASSASVAVITASARVVTFSAADGRQLWEQDLAGVPIPPVWAGNMLIVASSDRALWGLNGGNGKVAWKWRLGGTPIGMAADAENVYVTALDNVVRALRRGNGHQRWHTDLGTRALYPPVALDGAVLISGYSALTLFDTKTGTPISIHPTPAKLVGPPLVPLPIRPASVSTLVLQHDGYVFGLRSLGLRFPEQPPLPLAFVGLPGRTLSRERLPPSPQ